MQKQRLGKTGLMVTQIGMGGIPIQRLSEDDAVAVVRRCLDLGINFIDTAVAYTTSEERIGKAIAGRRDEVFLATKSLTRNPDELRDHIRASRQKLGVDYIDLYQLHQVGDFDTFNDVLKPGGLVDVLEEAKKDGLIRHIGVTSHQIDVAKALVKSDRFETIMFPLNFVAVEAADELLPLAIEHDVGFIGMKPFGGGILGYANIAFKYLLQFPYVVPIPGIGETGEIEEIIRLLEGSPEMTDAEKQQMQSIREKVGTRFCRRCDYCQPCQQQIPISMVMMFPDMIKTTPPEKYLTGRIAEMMELAGNCTECGDCEPRCPYELPIREVIAENFALYEAEKKKYRGRDFMK